MKDYFIWHGQKCTELGITVLELPEIVIPKERVTFTSIPGRSGAIATTEGTDVYDDITLSCTCYVKNTASITAIAAYLRGSSVLRLPNRPGGYYDARIINQISLERILRGSPARTFTVNFRCKPMFRLDSGEVPITVTSGQFLSNPTGIQARPLISITGSGDITLMVGMQIISLSGISGGIILDSEFQEAYYNGVLLNSRMNGDFPVLTDGNTAISWTGGNVTKVEVTPRWVSL